MASARKKGPRKRAADYESVALPVPAEGEAPDAHADRSLCPRCGGKLLNPDGLGWCNDCGYCRSVEKAEAVVGPPVEDESPRPKRLAWLGATDFGEALKRMPGWGWVLLGGMAVVGGASVAADYLLPEEGWPRALCSALQMVLSIVGLIAAQLWAVILIGSREDGLGAKDLILGGRVWRATLKRLPATRAPVWLGAWCLTALVCGAAIIGGFDYWLEAVRGSKVRRVAEAMEAGEGLSTAKEPAAAQGPAFAPPALMAAGTRPVAQCAVIGYQTDGTRVTGLILATADGDQLKYAGIVKEGLNPQLAKELMDQLSRLGREESLIPGLKVTGVRWVKPGLFCDVTHTGTDKDGHLERPAIKELRD